MRTDAKRGAEVCQKSVRVKLSNRVPHTPSKVMSAPFCIARVHKPRLHQHSLSLYDSCEVVNPLHAVDEDGDVKIDTGDIESNDDDDCSAEIVPQGPAKRN